MTLSWLRRVLFVVCVVVAIVSGIYFGLFSCGGFVWHKQLHRGIEAVTAAAWVFATILIHRATPTEQRRPLRILLVCTVFYFAIHEFFVLVMAVVGPFSIAPPQSVVDWWRGFLRIWQLGSPC